MEELLTAPEPDPKLSKEKSSSVAPLSTTTSASVPDTDVAADHEPAQVEQDSDKEETEETTKEEEKEQEVQDDIGVHQGLPVTKWTQSLYALIGVSTFSFNIEIKRCNKNSILIFI